MEEATSDVYGGEPATQPDNPATDAGAPGADQFSIPDEYKEKGWTKNIKSYDDLWKMNDSAQALIGKKTIGIPTEESSDQEWSDYYAKLRPQNATDYNVELEEGDKELFEKLFYDNGINTRQAKALVDGYKQSIAMVENELKSEAGYQQELSNRFGNEAQNISKNVIDFISREASQEDKAALNAMPNNVLGIVFSLVNKVQQRYAVKDTDTGITGRAGSDNGQPNWAEYNKAAAELARRPHKMTDLNALRDKYNIPYKG